MWHCNFNNSLGNWGNGSFGMTKCDCGDLHYRNPNPPQRSNFRRVPHDGSNVFKDVDKSRKLEVAPTTGGNHDGCTSLNCAARAAACNPDARSASRAPSFLVVAPLAVRLGTAARSKMMRFDKLGTLLLDDHRGTARLLRFAARN